MTGYLVAAGILLVLAYCGLIMLVEVFAKWALSREHERTAAATFEADYIAENADVAGPDAEVDLLIELAHIEDMLDDALATVRGWSK